MLTIKRNPMSITVEVDGCTFTIRPPRHDDFLMGLTQSMPFGEQYRPYVMDRMGVKKRITEWTGVGFSEDDPAECNDENKEALFAERPDILERICVQLSEREEELRKNSNPSHDG